MFWWSLQKMGRKMCGQWKMHWGKLLGFEVGGTPTLLEFSVFLRFLCGGFFWGLLADLIHSGSKAG
jgi:hypothetical protein